MKARLPCRHAGTGCGLPLANDCTGTGKRGYGIAEAVGLTPGQNLVRDVLAPLEAALDCCPVVALELSERQRALLVEPAQLRRIERFQGHVRSLNDRGAAVRSARRPVGHEDRPVCRAPDAVLRVEHRGVHGRRHADGLRIAEGAGDDRVEHHLVPDEGFIDLSPDLRGMGPPLRRLLAHGAGRPGEQRQHDKNGGSERRRFHVTSCSSHAEGENAGPKHQCLQKWPESGARARVRWASVPSNR